MPSGFSSMPTSSTRPELALPPAGGHGASWPDSLERAAGVLWHVNFYMRGRAVEASTLWHHDYVASVRPPIVHMLADGPRETGFTFSAVDDGTEIADAIGRLFDAIL
jgi:hypothetical protein